MFPVVRSEETSEVQEFGDVLPGATVPLSLAMVAIAAPLPHSSGATTRHQLAAPDRGEGLGTGDKVKRSTAQPEGMWKFVTNGSQIRILFPLQQQRWSPPELGNPPTEESSRWVHIVVRVKFLFITVYVQINCPDVSSQLYGSTHIILKFYPVVLIGECILKSKKL